MKRLKKALLGLLCAVVVLNAGVPMAMAMSYSAPDVQSSAVVSPQAEETEWAYKQVNGVWYKRLWSITYAKWLTDWMPL